MSMTTPWWETESVPSEKIHSHDGKRKNLNEHCICYFLALTDGVHIHHLSSLTTTILANRNVKIHVNNICQQTKKCVTSNLSPVFPIWLPFTPEKNSDLSLRSFRSDCHSSLQRWTELNEWVSSRQLSKPPVPRHKSTILSWPGELLQAVAVYTSIQYWFGTKHIN